MSGEGGAVYYIRTDPIGRPVFATDAAGAKVWEVSYLPFGGVHTSTGPNSELRFPGQWFQAESGLHQNWMRDYDPTTGRYMQADPLGLVDGASVYGYAGQNPGRYTDFTGQCPWCIVGGIAAGLVYGAYGEYQDHGANLRCYDWFKIGALGATGGLLVAAAPALWGTAAGAFGNGGFMVNGMLHSSRSGLSVAFSNISRQITRATGNGGLGLSNHHWLFAQSGRVFGSRLGQSQIGQHILNSRLLMNRIPSRLNSSIGNNILSGRNIFGGGAPGWVPTGIGFGGVAGLAALGSALSDSEDGCRCGE